jgi:uncharacterized membrane protein
MEKLRNWPWVPFALLAIGVGLYPSIYYLTDMNNMGLLQGKSIALKNSISWHTLFYVHITFGGIAMLTGWTQFSARLRARYMPAHRVVGKIYVIAVLLSSCGGFYIAIFASGGIVSVLGFGTLALLWLFTDIMAYSRIRQLNIPEHRKWMIRNYALTFAAVTLRIYLPLMTPFLFHGDFINAYRTISWLCWVPNLAVAEIIIRRSRSSSGEAAVANF